MGQQLTCTHAAAPPRLQVLNICSNPEVDRIPLAPAAAAALQRLCCDLPALADAGSGALLRGAPSLAEVDVLWGHAGVRPRSWDEPWFAEARQELQQGEQAALAALREAPALRLVAVEGACAAALNRGFSPASIPPDASAAFVMLHLVRPANEAARAAWAQWLPGIEVGSVHMHLGPGRRLPDFDKPEWDTCEA